MTVDISVIGSVVTPETREIGDRIAEQMANLATAFVDGVSPPMAIATCCAMIEDDYMDLRRRGVDFEKFAFQVVGEHALHNCSREQLLDDEFRKSLAGHLLDLVHWVDTPLDRQWQAQVVTSQIAEARLEAVASMGVDMTEAVIEREYIAAAAFVTEQLKAGKPIIKARPKRPYSFDLTSPKPATVK
jgi:hypothetical protein